MTWKLRWLVALIFALLFFGINQAFAQSADSCEQNPGNPAQWFKYRINGQSYNGGVPTAYEYASKAAACSANESGFCAWAPASGSCDAGSTPWHAHATFSNTSCQTEDGFTAGSIARQSQANPAVDCPAAPSEIECVMPSNPETGIANFWPYPGDPGPQDACDVSSHCLTHMRGGTVTCGPTECGAVYDWEDAACDGLTTPPDDTPPEMADPLAPAPAERCNTIGEAEYCVSTDPPGNDAQCGFLNDDYICVTATPSNGCQDAPGGALCDPAAATPPGPDNGTPGTPATPDGQVAAAARDGNTANTYNYFNNTTINNSSHGITTGHVPVGNDQDGDGFTDENEEEGPSGTASGGQSCTAMPACEGDQIQCAILAQEWRARCPDEVSDEEVLDAIGVTGEERQGFEEASGGEEIPIETLDATGIFGASSCPAPINISVMGASLSLDVWAQACNMATLFAPFVLAIGYLTAAFVFVGKGQ